MTSGQNNMDNNSDEQLLTIHSTIISNRQYYDKKIYSAPEDLKEMISPMVDQIKMLKYSPDQKDSTKAQDPTTVVLNNNRDPPLEGENYTHNGGIQKIKNETYSPEFYELLIKT